MIICNTYKYRFDWWALILLVVVMIPNIIWGIFSPSDDVLRIESQTPIADTIGSISQVLMLASLMLLRRKNSPSTNEKNWNIATLLLTTLYLICWISHFMGYTPKAFIIAMAVIPCMFFGSYAIGKRNFLALFFCAIFSVCHILFAVVNY